MRITQSLIAQIAQRRTSQGSSAVFEATQRITAESAIGSPVDNPVAAGRIGRLTTYLNDLDTLGSNRSIVRNDLNAAEVVLDSVNSVIVQAQELSLQMSSDNANAEIRDNGAIAADALFDQLKGVVNQLRSGGKYLFGGLQEQRPPIDDDGNYQGDLGAREVGIGPGQTITATLNGNDVFGPNNEVLTAFRDFSSALRSNDADGIRASIDKLAEARSIVAGGWTGVGARLATLDSVEGLSEDLKVALELEKIDLTQVDFAKGASDLAIAQTALEAVVLTSRGLLERASSSWLR